MADKWFREKRTKQDKQLHVGNAFINNKLSSNLNQHLKNSLKNKSISRMAIFFCAIQAENIDTFLKIKKKTF
jgi:hypothetical protein